MFDRAASRATGYGIATGAASGVIVVDIDGPEALAEAQRRGLTSERIVRTGRPGGGGFHLYFDLPPGVEVKSRVLAPGLELKAEGTYVVGPGSLHPSGQLYRLVRAGEPSPAPASLLEPEETPGERALEPSEGSTGPATFDAVGPPIPYGGRNRELTRIAGRLHDGTRDLEALTRDLEGVNNARCLPPLPAGEVAKISKSIHGREPCRAGRPQEVEDLVEALSGFWNGRAWEGLAGKSEARFARALIREGRKVGTAIPIGLRIGKSYRQMAEILGVHRNTIVNLVRRSKAAGWLRQDNAGRSGAESGAFVLVDPRRLCDTITKRHKVGDGVTSSSRPVAELTTPHYRHRGPVGYSREHTLCVFEANGPQDREIAAEILGWSRPRDLERLHLEPLAELGLLEKSGDLYALPGDHRERQGAVRGREYSTVQARVARERSVEGRFVYVVKDSGIVASESDRAELDRERHERERQAYRDGARPDAHYVNVGADGYVEDLRPAPDPDRALVGALRAYLDRNPHDAGRSSYWIGATLWCLDLLDGKPMPEEVRAAMGELGGTPYLEAVLKRAKVTA